MVFEYFALILSFTTIQVLGLLTPGPTLAITVSNGLLYSRKTATVTALGISIGTVAQILIIILGLSLLKSLLINVVIRVMGGVYLVYLGYVTYKKTQAGVYLYRKKTGEEGELSESTAFFNGFLVNILNPQAFLYFVGMLSIFVTQQTPWQLTFIYVCIIYLTTVCWYNFVAYSCSHKVFKEFFSNSKGAIQRVAGMVLIGIGIKLLIDVIRIL